MNTSFLIWKSAETRKENRDYRRRNMQLCWKQIWLHLNDLQFTGNNHHHQFHLVKEILSLLLTSSVDSCIAFTIPA